MMIFLENKALGRTIKIEASDDFMSNPENIRVIAGTECYELKSTKSETDKRRETLALEFANEVFPRIQDANPKSDDEITKLLVDALESDKWKELSAISDKEMLKMTLVTGYKRFNDISSKVYAINAKITDNKKDEIPFFDYCLRFIELIKNSKCINDFNRGLFELKEMSDIDPRGAVGILTLYECMSPLLNEINSVLRDASSANKAVKFAELPICNDADVWILRFANQSEDAMKRLKSMYLYWKDFFTERGLGHDLLNDSKYDCYLNLFLDDVRPIVRGILDLQTLTKEDKDAVAIEKKIAEVKKLLVEYHGKMRVLEIMENVDPRTYDSIAQQTFVDTKFTEYREVDRIANDVFGTEKERYTTTEYLMKIVMNYRVTVAVVDGDLDVDKLISGGYTEQELRSIIENKK